MPVEQLTDLTLTDLVEMGKAKRAPNPDRERKIGLYLDIFESALSGDRRGRFALQEAMSTAEFPGIFGDILDRAVYARFTEWVPPFERFMATGTFADLTRDKMRRQQRGGNGALSEVGEGGLYPIRGVEFEEFAWKGAKYGADFAVTMETLLADDLNEFRNLPNVLASAARVSEGLFATRLYVDANGPHASLYTAPNGNLGSLPLTIEGLEAGITAMSLLRDPAEPDIPIYNRPRYLVVPPALEIQARKILASQTVAYAATAAAAVPLTTTNVVNQYGIELVVDPNIPVIATSNGDTSWFLFSDPQSGPLGPGLAAVEFDRLRGMERPVLLQKRGQFSAIGGGPDPRGELDEVDSLTYRVMHAFGGSRLFWQATYASTGNPGSGS